ncbi:hypothetical protein [Alkalicoccus chagannorensis]|uniref:hypothetical protein n=1 Tax=Alkalicoccus chagannorensis TaxID=427072 RepID=UPI000400C0B4|nr:hypothetical protein [Alkalicoccus chagannorensis]
MLCRDAERHLLQYHGQSEDPEVTEHLHTCASCRETAEELQQLQLFQLDKQRAPSIDLPEAVSSSAANGTSAPETKPPRRAAGSWVSLTAAALLIVFLLLWDEMYYFSADTFGFAYDKQERLVYDGEALAADEKVENDQASVAVEQVTADDLATTFRVRITAKDEETHFVPGHNTFLLNNMEALWPEAEDMDIPMIQPLPQEPELKDDGEVAVTMQLPPLENPDTGTMELALGPFFEDSEVEAGEELHFMEGEELSLPFHVVESRAYEPEEPVYLDQHEHMRLSSVHVGPAATAVYYEQEASLENRTHFEDEPSAVLGSGQEASLKRTANLPFQSSSIEEPFVLYESLWYDTLEETTFRHDHRIEVEHEEEVFPLIEDDELISRFDTSVGSVHIDAALNNNELQVETQFPALSLPYLGTQFHLEMPQDMQLNQQVQSNDLIIYDEEGREQPHFTAYADRHQYHHLKEETATLSTNGSEELTLSDLQGLQYRLNYVVTRTEESGEMTVSLQRVEDE